MTIDLLQLLHQSETLLIFTILAIGLTVGRIRFGTFKIGNTIGVLFVALLFGQIGFQIDTSVQSVGFMLFIFCVGIEAGPHFFSVFFRDGLRYIALTLVIIASAEVLVLICAKVLNMGPGLTAGILAGSLTSTPALVAAQDALSNGVLGKPIEIQTALSDMSIGYALTYLIGLIGLMLLMRYQPVLLGIDLEQESRKVARERGLDGSDQSKVYLPIIRAYRVGPELAAWIGGRSLRETGIYPHTGCYVERIRRNGIIAAPDGDAVIKEGDEIALIGYPESHEKLDLNYRNGKEVFDRDLLDRRVITEDIVVKHSSVVGKHLRDIKLTEQGCFLDNIIRSQIQMPTNRDIMLQKGDVLRISGEQNKVQKIADKLGFINVHSQTSDLVSFSGFFVLGLMIASISLLLGNLHFSLGNAVGLLIAGILMGYLRANHPTMGYVPTGALRLAKDLGLTIFMACIGINAGGGLLAYIQSYGVVVMISGLIVCVFPVLIGYLFGIFVLKMNPALLLGAITGARTCAPAVELLHDMSKNNIPSLGYAGTYAIANVIMTLAGSSVIALCF